MKVAELLEGLAGTAQAQSKKTTKKLRDSGTMEKKGHWHKKGEDWEKHADGNIEGLVSPEKVKAQKKAYKKLTMVP